MRILATISGILMLTISSVFGGTIQVPGDYSTIQAGMNAAENGDTVLVADGIYTGFGNKDLDYHGKAIAVISEHGSEATIIDCEDAGRGFYFHSGEGPGSRLEGFTIRHGYPYLDDGGGIYCSNSSPSVTNCIIIHNRANKGAGILCDNSMLTLTDCVIRGNRSLDYGGGFYSEFGSSPSITSCSITKNIAQSGGGIYSSSVLNVIGCTITENTVSNSGGGIYLNGYIAPNFTDCDILNNTAYRKGGGIYCYRSSPHLTNCNIIDNISLILAGGICCDNEASPEINNCSFLRNIAGDGGAIWCTMRGPLVTNCTISENSAQNNGGGIYCYLSYSHLRLVNCIITENTAQNDGGGIYCSTLSYPYIANCTIAKNTAYREGGGINCYNECYPNIVNCILWDCSPEEIHLSSSEPTVTYSDVEGGWAGVGNIDVDPYFRDSDNGDFHLMATYCDDPYDSPCIDKGDPSIIDSLLDCFHGLGAERSDMGAYGGDNVSWPTAVGENEECDGSPIPSSFSLYQNYPNPFNASTEIRYKIPKDGHVSLMIFNILGQEVRTIVNAEQEAGIYVISWNGRDFWGEELASGFYFCRLQVGDFEKTIKMVLVR